MTIRAVRHIPSESLSHNNKTSGQGMRMSDDGVNVTAINPCRQINVAVRLSFFIDFV